MKKTADNTQVKEYDVEGVFIIGASNKNVFFNRLQKLESFTSFSTGGFDSYEEDEGGGCWKVITMGVYESLDKVKEDIKRMKKYNWFFDMDADLLMNGKEIYSGGQWIEKNILFKQK